MVSIEFLNEIRAYELEKIAVHFPAGARILEIGCGTGIQAKMLTEMGYNVIGIELPESIYADERVFPVTEYDGKKIPFENDSFDIVFSSNVLEHIVDLEGLFEGCRRVMRPGGRYVHVMPTGAWRFWTNLTHYAEFLQRLVLSLSILAPRSLTLAETRRPLWWAREVISLARYYAVPHRHGEFGSCITEIHSFSHGYWLKRFKELRVRVTSAVPMGLFYTGHMFLGKRWSLDSRKRWSRLLGSACYLYLAEPE